MKIYDNGWVDTQQHDHITILVCENSFYFSSSSRFSTIDEKVGNNYDVGKQTSLAVSRSLTILTKYVHKYSG